MSLKEKLVNQLLHIILSYLNKYPKTENHSIFAWMVEKDKKPYRMELPTFTIQNGVVVPEACAIEGAALWQAIKQTKTYIDEMLKDNYIWVRIMPECRNYNGLWWIRARFITYPKNEVLPRLSVNIGYSDWRDIYKGGDEKGNL